jgi:hypothetical protein
MNISALVKKLEAIRARHGDIDVMFCGDGRSTYSAECADFRVAEEGEYPDSWNMPAGTEFVEITD